MRSRAYSSIVFFNFINYKLQSFNTVSVSLFWLHNRTGKECYLSQWEAAIWMWKLEGWTYLVQDYIVPVTSAQYNSPQSVAQASPQAAESSAAQGQEELVYTNKEWNIPFKKIES